MKEWVSKNARNLPLIGGVIRMAEGLGYISMGGKDNIMLGLKTLASAGFAQFGLGGVFDWLFGSTEVDATEGEKTNKVGNVLKFITGYIRDVLWDKIKAGIDRAKKWVIEKSGQLGELAIGAMEDIGLLPKGGKAAVNSELKTERMAYDTLQDENSTDAQKENAFKALERFGTDTTRMRSKLNSQGSNEQTEAIKEQTEAIKEQNQLMKENQSMGGNTTVANQSTTNQQQNNYNHTPTGVTAQRNAVRQYKMRYA